MHIDADASVHQASTQLCFTISDNYKIGDWVVNFKTENYKNKQSFVSNFNNFDNFDNSDNEDLFTLGGLGSK